MKKIKQQSLTLIFIFALLGIVVPSTIIYQLNKKFKSQVLSDERMTFEKGVATFEEKLLTYTFGLKSYAGIYMMSDYNPTSKKLDRYARSRGYFSNMKGIRGFGFMRRVPKLELNDYVKKRRKEFPDFTIKYISEFSKGDLTIIDHMEPHRINRTAFGLVVSSEEKRYETLKLAMETGLPTLSPKIPIVALDPLNPHSSIGYLLVQPVYNDEDHNKLVGFVYTFLDSDRLKDLLLSFFDKNLRIKIFDQDKQIILDTHPEEPDRNFIQRSFSKSLEMGQKKWKVYGSYIDEPYLEFIDQISLVLLFLILSINGYFLTKYYLILKAKKNSEMKNFELESWREAMLDSSVFAIISIGEGGLISTFNSAAEKMLGYKASEVINLQSPLIFHDPDEVRQFHTALEAEAGHPIPKNETFSYKAVRDQVFIHEWTFITATGERIPVRLCLTTFKDEIGKVKGYLGIAENLTEIQAMRNIMVSNAKMSALGEMAAGIAHEINNPLAIITASTKMLKRIVQKKAAVDPELETIIEVSDEIQATSIRIAKIVSGLRTFARESSSDPMMPVNIDQIIKDTIGLCQEKFKLKNIDLTYEKHRPVNVLCRPVQISQVMMNLLSNAADAIEELPVKWIKIQVQIMSDNNVHILITDSGNGIPEDVLKRIFNPFYTTKPVGKGTGLGLSISKGIMESHKGALDYHTFDGHTQFVLTLPKAG